MERARKEKYEESVRNLENMSYWLPRILQTKTFSHTNLKVPQTTIVPLSFERWSWLSSDRYKEEKIREFSDWLEAEVRNFLTGCTLFMKTGVFSGKFQFDKTIVDDRTKIGEQFLHMYYDSMMFGADKTAEVVLREFIVDAEDKPTIYNGMALHTEFCVFYDFDHKEVMGVANYWHPAVMNGGLHEEEDKRTYGNIQDELVSDFDDHKSTVAEEVEKFMKGCDLLSGKWSVDIMKNGEDYWLIDMARMDVSALVQQMEPVRK